MALVNHEFAPLRRPLSEDERQGYAAIARARRSALARDEEAAYRALRRVVIGLAVVAVVLLAAAWWGWR